MKNLLLYSFFLPPFASGKCFTQYSTDFVQEDKGVMNWFLEIKIKNILMAILLVLCTSFLYSQNLIRDNSFGNAGVVNTNYAYSNNIIRTTMLLEDHKFMAFGASRMVRYNENGSVDNTFGVNGEFVFPSLTGVNKISLINGSFYVIGKKYFSAPNYGDVFILKVTYDGLLDTSFGDNGVFIYNINEDEELFNLKITSDNKIIGAGIKKSGIWQKLFLIRLNANGTIDNTFQNNGYKEVFVFPIETSAVQAMSEIEGGKFIVACSGRMELNSTSVNRLALIKLNTDGDYDLTFNSTGNYLLPELPYYIHSVSFKDNHLYLCYGVNQLYDLNYNAYLYNIDLNTFISQYTVIDRDTSYYIINPDSSIITLSMNRDLVNVNPNRNLFIKKYNSNGNLDTSFCNTGSFEFNLSDINNYQTDDVPNNLIIYDDKFLVLGQSQIPHSGISTYKATFTRFNAVPLAADTFKMDKFKVYPNPTAALLTIQNEGNLPIQHIAIIDQLGKVVLEQFNDFTTVNLASLQNGFYMLQITTDREKLVYKVVKR